MSVLLWSLLASTSVSAQEDREDRSVFHLRAGAAALESDEVALAVQHFEELVANQPDDPFVASLLEEARARLREAQGAAAGSDLGYLREALAVALAWQRQSVKAQVSYADRILQLDPSDILATEIRAQFSEHSLAEVRDETAAEVTAPSTASDLPAGKVIARSELGPPEVIFMESPMVLEVELGPLDGLLPESRGRAGQSWRTTELARYEVGKVYVPMLTASPREFRGQTEIELTINLAKTAKVSTRVDLEVDLLSNGVRIARQEKRNIGLFGGFFSCHGSEEGLPYSVRFALETAAFAELFADGKRPSVRLTVVVH